MSKKRVSSRCLVIDASIARAASTMESRHPRGTICRDFLLAVRRVCHRLAWSEAISREWKRHQGRFATTWLASMTKLTTKLRPVKDEQLQELRTAIEEHSTDEGIVAILHKDVHLIEAALATDLRIASLDDTAREHFRSLAVKHEPLRRIIWVNPVNEAERVVEWLEEGAPAQRSRRLKR
jgi:hypothetical protein